MRFVLYHNIKDNEKNLCQDLLTIHRKQKDSGCTFYHNTLRTKLSPQGIWKDMVYGIWKDMVYGSVVYMFFFYDSRRNSRALIG